MTTRQFHLRNTIAVRFHATRHDLHCAHAHSGHTAFILLWPLKRDEIGLNRRRALGFLIEHDLSENRCTLFRIML